MKVAALQMVSTPDVAQNLAAARELLRQAQGAGAELAALPEYFCAMGLRDTDKLGYMEAIGRGPIQEFLAQSARELGLWIVGGTLPLEAGDAQHVRNATLVFSPAGECVTRYDKIHLFRYDNGRERYDEAQVIAAGQAPVHVDMTDRSGTSWRLGLSICYDLRFPELYRAHAQQGCDLLLVPSAFTHTTGEAHWEVLLRARAIENQAYVLAPAQGGRHPNGRHTWGHSMLVDPWGQVLGVRDQGPGLVLGELERGRLAQVRAQLPALQHRIL
ncbi:carbon-nitrogen hydrolase family protein [Comamonas endophytica]|uniref:Carbon-nitrogen hydrolase family protein n=1 Tax=Comamonas endophytica TaxID=2949090 RepID=A0ABY6G5E5_9BURK|nr:MULTISPECIES: carbon-nitrogen hydrolase family protein [unclassified Acidovorax]MCD2512321.1 carbon-nitrogen hydrolase family protein [Acidovorax sp. D4N7]UYG50225.1 carbon-nitrogen hydrolase family protein [Acidovorax sp. 5MLIR]